MEITHVVIAGTFPTLNEFIGALNSRNRNVGNGFKKRLEREIQKQLEVQLTRPLKPKVSFAFAFYEPSKRRDKDNVFSLFIKVWQDALVKAGYLENDGWRQINNYKIEFFEEKAFPRIEIFISESED